MKARPCWCFKPILGVELFSYANAFFCSNKWPREWKLYSQHSRHQNYSALFNFIKKKRRAFETRIKILWDDPCFHKSEYRLGLQKKRLGKSNKVKHSECTFLDLHGQVRIIKNMFGTGSNIHLYLLWKRFRVAENRREHSPRCKQKIWSADEPWIMQINTEAMRKHLALLTICSHLGLKVDQPYFNSRSGSSSISY